MTAASVASTTVDTTGQVKATRASDGVGVNVLQSTTNNSPSILAEAGGSGGTALQFNVTGESVNRFSSHHSGRMEWGSGSATRDTNLYRSAADTLRTDDKLIAGAGINVGTASTPASATASGTASDIRYDADYLYVCTATNTWKRAALSSW